MLCQQQLNFRGPPGQGFDQGGGRIAVLDGQTRQGYACFSDSGFDILRVPIQRSSEFGYVGHSPSIPVTSETRLRKLRCVVKRQNRNSWNKGYCGNAEGYMTDIAEKTTKSAIGGHTVTTITVDSNKRSGPEMADRLRRALIGQRRVDIIGASGVSDGTITRALRGQPTRRGTLASLADAMGISQDWLIDGAGPMRRLPVGSVTDEGHVVTEGPMMPFEQPLFSTMNMDRAARALATADQMFAAKRAAPTDRERVQAMALIYDMLLQQERDQERSKTESSPNTG
jgi:hypothetical protein